jgi:Lactate racemase N-terminal domain
MTAFPRILGIRQYFPPTASIDIRAALAGEFAKLRPGLQPGARIAVGVGSRGITQIRAIVTGVIAELQAAGTHPFIIPAMGSHGGATPAGQRAVLASYDITEASLGVPIEDSLEVRVVGRTDDGWPVYGSVAALAADGILLVNRVKPHTDFLGTLGSGLLKMSVIGLGKHQGAAAMHRLAARVGHEAAIRSMAEVVVRTTPLIGGVAILENAFHETARLIAIPRAEMATAETALLETARELLPRLPFDEIDLLIVDRIGKNISGAGLDPNVTGRWVDGYSSDLRRRGRPAPFIRRIFVRDLTPETHGNGIGIGLADVTTARLVRALDLRATSINALTALTPHTAKIPIHFETDREAISRSLESLAIDDVSTARVVRIADTLSLGDMAISEALWATAQSQPSLTVTRPPAPMAFDAEGNLV